MPPMPPIVTSPCAEGFHSPRHASAREDGGLKRTTCRICGCALVRTAATRRWFFSGLLA